MSRNGSHGSQELQCPLKKCIRRFSKNHMDHMFWVSWCFYTTELSIFMMNHWIFGVLLTMALKKRGGWSQFQSNSSPRLLLPYLPTFTNNDSSKFCLGFHEVGNSRIRPYFEGISPWKRGLKNVVGTSKTSVPGMAKRFCCWVNWSMPSWGETF